MIEKDLGKVLNYMKQYVENKYEHDSEPMLNYKDLQLVLEEIERLQSIIKEVRECLNKNRVYIYGERNLAFEIEQILDKEVR